MGACFSCKPVAVSPTDTAKVVFPDGALREFATPVAAGHVLAEETACFLCDADEMELDGHVSAVVSGHELRPGQLYFVLPRRMLDHRLPADELAALAVRASAALVRASAGKGGPLVFPDTVDKVEAVATAVEIEMKVAELKRRRSRKKRKVGGGSSVSKFMPELSAIPE